VNQQGSAIARLLRLPDSEADFAATAQQFGMAATVELIIVICMMAWEALGREKRAVSPPAHQEVPLEPELIVPGPEPQKLPPPPRPRLVVARKETPAGPIPRIMTAALEPAEGQRVELGECYIRYAAACRAEGRDPRRTNDLHGRDGEVLQRRGHQDPNHRGKGVPAGCVPKRARGMRGAAQS
jgi:hypothetical protein